jgi:rod shape-determining protein MreC
VVQDKKYTALIILAVLVVLLNLPLPASLRLKAFSRENMGPFQSAAMLIVHKAREGFRLVFQARSAISQRQALVEEIANLQHKVRTLQSLERDNEALRESLGFRDRSQRRLMLAEIIARRDTSGWWQTITINRGSRDGFRPNLAVVTARGLIGKIRMVTPHTSEVLLVTDPNCRVACRLTRTGAFGILRGQGFDGAGRKDMEMLLPALPARMEYIDKTSEVHREDEVVTSGLGGVFPEGLLVGYVDRVGADPTGLHQHAFVVPAANMTAMKYVFVVLPLNKEDGSMGVPPGPDSPDEEVP